MAESNTYHLPAIQGPQMEDLRELNQELNFKLSEEELKQMLEVMGGVTETYERVSRIPDPSVPRVKYPRTPGYRPGPEDNPFNAWAWKCDIQGAPSGKLAGKTVAIKDNTAVAGVPLNNGTNILQGYIPEFDATVVTRILDAGGRILGKSAVEASCFSGSSITSRDGPIRNPVDESCIAGGSSGGSAALVAGGQVDMATGGDQGGSIRIPASFTGIVGLKPTWGLVPYTGAASIETTVDHLGPMARTVADCALMLEVLAGYDEGRDPRQLPGVQVPEYSKLLDQGVKGKKIGLLTEGFELCSEEVVKTVVREAANKLTQAGCAVQEWSIPMHKEGSHIWMVSAGQGAVSAMVDCSGGGTLAKGFYPVSMQEAIRRGLATNPFDQQPLMKYLTMYMRHVQRLYGNHWYGKGQNLVLELTRRYDDALKEVDVLVMPTLTHVAHRIPGPDLDFKGLVANCLSMTSNTMPFNSTGHPALSINAGFSPPDAQLGKGRLPIGLMIVGRKYNEVTVLRVARAVEKLTASK